MLHIVKNMALGATGQFREISAANDNPLAWIAALVTLISAGIWIIPGSTLGVLGAPAACLVLQGQTRSMESYGLAIVATVTTLAPLLALHAIGAPALVLLIAQLYLVVRIGRAFAMQTMEAHVRALELDAAIEDTVRRMRAGPSAQATFVEMGPAIGRLYDVDIPAWFVDSKGRKHDFLRCHTGPSIPVLEADDSIVAPGLVYRLSTLNQEPDQGDPSTGA